MKIIKKTTGIIFLLASILLSFSCDKEVSVSPPDPPVHTGFLSINSNPAGTAIYVNNKNTGRHTPDSLQWMEGNAYTITLKYPLYKDTTFTVDIKENLRRDIFIDYYSNPSMYGKISCETDPSNATIYLDGKNSGKVTPHTFENLIPGSYKIKYQYPGCRDDSIKVVVESSISKSAYRKLTDTTIWVTYNSANSGLPTNSLSAILIDRNDIKWVGTLGEGIVRFDGNNWQSFKSKNSPMPNDFVTSIVSDNQGNLWIGTNSGLAVLSGNQWSVYNTSNSVLPDDYITSIAIDRNGVKWIGTQKGLVKIQGTAWTLFTTDNSKLPGDNIERLATEFNGTVWIGVTGVGLVTFNGGVWNSITKENSGLPGHYVTALAVGQFLEGVWAGFVRNMPPGVDEGGLAVRENGVWHNNYSTLPSRAIHSITIKDNIKWVSTAAGLLKFYDSSRWDILNTGNTPLPSNDIGAVSLDSQGYMWIVTSAGLVKYKK